ncbi:hypothetical protein Ahy_B08g092499 [Arachis hypogaea]|uniref:Aminotransferase-like plant mobile domain-containing protein n=1 Tax=Arachis hypogaea TaxID=3818 RepID=A0A444Y478_ARAHY|nr:hypothetical protein Ahy_B08g092499 [Arachis hypogaea]
MYHEHATTAGYAPGREDRSILAYAGLYHLARLNESWFRLDEPLVSAFVERWRPKIHTFQMSFGEYMITLHDVVYQLGLPIDGHYETLGELSDGADEPTVRRYARAYIMMLLENQLFGDKSSTRIHIRWLPYVARLEDMDSNPLDMIRSGGLWPRGGQVTTLQRARRDLELRVGGSG